ncbi:MAG: hypothetical protein R3F39_16565 [Myxococcota bacterium]
MLLQCIIDAASQARADGREPLAVLDVDLTLLDNAPRNRAIWGDWLHTVRDTLPGAEAAMVRAQTMPMAFGVMDNLRTLGVTDPALCEEGFRFWRTAFTSDHYCRFDAPLPGAVRAVGLLREADITVVYLTARPRRMMEATVARFGALGLPVGGPGAFLVMNDDPTLRDTAYKEQVLGWISRLGRPVLAADNEPGHVNAMAAAFSHARVVLVQTRHSPGAPEPTPEILKFPTLLDAIRVGGSDGPAAPAPAPGGRS